MSNEPRNCKHCGTPLAIRPDEQRRTYANRRYCDERCRKAEGHAVDRARRGGSRATMGPKGPQRTRVRPALCHCDHCGRLAKNEKQADALATVFVGLTRKHEIWCEPCVTWSGKQYLVVAEERE